MSINKYISILDVMEEHINENKVLQTTKILYDLSDGINCLNQIFSKNNSKSIKKKFKGRLVKVVDRNMKNIRSAVEKKVGSEIKILKINPYYYFQFFKNSLDFCIKDTIYSFVDMGLVEFNNEYKEKAYKASRESQKKILETFSKMGLHGKCAEIICSSIDLLSLKENSLNGNDNIINGTKYLEYADKKYDVKKNIKDICKDIILDNIPMGSVYETGETYYNTQAFNRNFASAQALRGFHKTILEFIDSQNYSFEKLFNNYQELKSENDDIEYTQVNELIEELYRVLNKFVIKSDEVCQYLLKKSSILDEIENG